MAKEIVKLQNRVKELEHNLVDWNRSQITDRKRIKELEELLGKIVEDANCADFCGAELVSSNLITEAEEMFKKQAGFEDEISNN